MISDIAGFVNVSADICVKVMEIPFLNSISPVLYHAEVIKLSYLLHKVIPTSK